MEKKVKKETKETEETEETEETVETIELQETTTTTTVQLEVSDLEVAKKMIKISQSAQDRKLEFNLKFETVKRLMNYNTCYYTNRQFDEKEGSTYARSFDRVDSSKGYIEGNVVACTIDINQKKANLTIDEIIFLYNKLVPNENSKK